jgi:hypothetical protein
LRNREQRDLGRRLLHLPRYSIFWLALTLALFAQSPEEGRITRTGERAILHVESPRPLDSAAMTLARYYGISVSVEDPPYIFEGDVKDVTAEVARTPNLSHRVLIPKGGTLEVSFPVGADDFPADVPRLLENIVKAANESYPFAYRLDSTGGRFTLIPTQTRDASGSLTKITPLLDRHVTIPLATRTIIETAALMAEALSAETGLRVSCCQSVIAGYPWGMSKISFEAHDEPVRSVLTRLIAANLQGKPDHSYWLQRCDPLPSKWCFINLSFAEKPGSSAFHD